MAKSDAIAKAIAADPYLKKRKAPTEAEQQLYLKDVSFSCPLCGKILRHNKQGKHRLTRAHREKQLKMSCQALHNAPPNRT